MLTNSLMHSVQFTESLSHVNLKICIMYSSMKPAFPTQAWFILAWLAKDNLRVKRKTHTHTHSVHRPVAFSPLGQSLCKWTRSPHNCGFFALELPEPNSEQDWKYVRELASNRAVSLGACKIMWLVMRCQMAVWGNLLFISRSLFSSAGLS